MIKHVFRWEDEWRIKSRMEPWICYQDGPDGHDPEEARREAAASKAKHAKERKMRAEGWVLRNVDSGLVGDEVWVAPKKKAAVKKAVVKKAVVKAPPKKAKSKSVATAAADPAPPPPPKKKISETHPPPKETPKFRGPAHDPDESITPKHITLDPVKDEEFVENRIASMLDKNSPLFRQAAESSLRQQAGRGLGRNTSMAQEEVMRAVMAVAGPIAEADSRMLERHRELNNKAYHQEMNTRLQGVIQKTLQHIAGGYQIQAAEIDNIRKIWEAQLNADLKEYGIDVQAASSKYSVDVGFEKTKYVTDMQERLGMEGVKVNAANILSGIEDNAEATAFIWDLIFGDNKSPGDWIEKWKGGWDQ